MPQFMTFTATKVQVATYLLAICPFSIAFLVFLNSSVSFVIIDLIGLRRGEGDAVGTLGFADELLALVACPAWGLLSDRIGVRTVCALGYLVVALSLVLFVQAKNVYPQLLLGRLLFSIGGAATTTMVTAILPTMTAEHDRSSNDFGSSTSVGPLPEDGRAQNAAIGRITREHADSVSSDSTITPARMQTQRRPPTPSEIPVERESTQSAVSSSRVAGFVGLFTGVGALLSLAIFLPLPARFQKAGYPPGEALQDSFYIVAAVAFVMSIVSFAGLAGIRGEANKGLLTMFSDATPDISQAASKIKPFWSRFSTAFILGFRRVDIGLGYVGGFVARASSVGISLFIPLAINAQFRSAGLCAAQALDNPAGLPDIKRQCPRAYTLAAELTGVSQLIALWAAPAFGYFTSRSKHRNVPLTLGAVAGIVGYIIFGVSAKRHRESVNGSAMDFVAMALIGLSQIAAIVCSLAVLSGGILQQDKHSNDASEETTNDQREPRHMEEDDDDLSNTDEMTGLVRAGQLRSESITDLKGSIAGMYSLYGGAGILLLTKLGGALFDSLSFATPFYIMAIFNGILFITCVVTALARSSPLKAIKP